MTSKQLLLLIFHLFLIIASKSALGQPEPAAWHFDTYQTLLQGKKVGLVVNQTSTIADEHLIDYLLARNVDVLRIYAPEHGLRGGAEAGETVQGGMDPVSGLPVVSLYGSHKKPSGSDLKEIDVMVFDIQDVGARFYTYISTMHYVMEACAENSIPLVILDRPNPNGHYVDGPVLDPAFKSFVGMDQIPVVHGMTIGELAQMINGEGWLNGLKCDLTVVPCRNYTHKSRYTLPVAPSPNLPNQQSIRWYPSLCLLEGTPISIGRGTEMPFQVAGYPDEGMGSFKFMPVSMPGKSLHPKAENKWCYGVDMRNLSPPDSFSLKWILYFYNRWQGDEPFFKPFFNTLAGTDQLRKQIEAGLNEEEIRLTWQEALNKFKGIRKQYLLYPDFE